MNKKIVDLFAIVQGVINGLRTNYLILDKTNAMIQGKLVLLGSLRTLDDFGEEKLLMLVDGL